LNRDQRISILIENSYQ
jgi:hypothetical protein